MCASAMADAGKRRVPLHLHTVDDQAYRRWWPHRSGRGKGVERRDIILIKYWDFFEHSGTGRKTWSRVRGRIECDLAGPPGATTNVPA